MLLFDATGLTELGEMEEVAEALGDREPTFHIESRIPKDAELTNDLHKLGIVGILLGEHNHIGLRAMCKALVPA